MKIIKFLLSSALTLAFVISPAYAESVIGSTSNLPSTSVEITGKINEKEYYIGSYTSDVIAFDVVWENTEIELTATENYGSKWNPDTLMWEKDEDSIYTNYLLENSPVGIKATVTNKSVVNINVQPDLKNLHKALDLYDMSDSKVVNKVIFNDTEPGTTATLADPVDLYVYISMRDGATQEDKKDLYDQIKAGNSVGTVSLIVTQ